jgi:hypothetical protein
MSSEKTKEAISIMAKCFYEFDDYFKAQVAEIDGTEREVIGALPQDITKIQAEDFIGCINDGLTAINFEGMRFTVPRKEFNEDWFPWEFEFNPPIPSTEDISCFLLVNEKEKKVCLMRTNYSVPPNFYIDRIEFYV